MRAPSKSTLSPGRELVVAGAAVDATKSHAVLSHEIELKFLVSKPVFRTIQDAALLGGSGARRPSQRLHSIYFDTEQGDLRRHRMILRMRRMRGNHLLTVKWDGERHHGIFERGEIEIATASPIPDLALLGADAQARVIAVTDGRPLQPCYATDIRREVRRIVAGSSEIEAAFDSGFIIFGPSKTPVCEIELELKSGDPADLYQFGLSLIHDFPVRLGVMSKAERGPLLSQGTHQAAVRARVPQLQGLTVDQAIAAVIGSCMSQFVANWPAFEGHDKAEAVHQMRVAMRRLRAALALFNRHFPCGEFRDLRAEAKRIASAMGDARNCDVFETLLHGGPLAAFPSEAGLADVMAAAAKRQAAGHAAVAHLLAHSETSRFVVSAEALVARRSWRNALSGRELPRLTEPARAFAAGCLARLHRRLCQRGKDLLGLPPDERHEVRIALKNLRYAVEFFGDLFAGAGLVKPYAKAAAKLQDALGAYNDMVMTTGLVEQLNLTEPASVRATGIIVGWYAQEARATDEGLAEAWKRFQKTEQFWLKG